MWVEIAPLGATWSQEVPAGTINGSNTSFTLAYSPASVIVLCLNGLLQRQGAGYDYTVSGQTITMNFAPQPGDSLVAVYSH